MICLIVDSTGVCERINVNKAQKLFSPEVLSMIAEIKTKGHLSRQKFKNFKYLSYNEGCYNFEYQDTSQDDSSPPPHILTLYKSNGINGNFENDLNLMSTVYNKIDGLEFNCFLLGDMDLFIIEKPIYHSLPDKFYDYVDEYDINKGIDVTKAAKLYDVLMKMVGFVSKMHEENIVLAKFNKSNFAQNDKGNIFLRHFSGSFHYKPASGRQKGYAEEIRDATETKIQEQRGDTLNKYWNKNLIPNQHAKTPNYWSAMSQKWFEVAKISDFHRLANTILTSMVPEEKLKKIKTKFCTEWTSSNSQTTAANKANFFGEGRKNYFAAKNTPTSTECDIKPNSYISNTNPLKCSHLEFYGLLATILLKMRTFDLDDNWSTNSFRDQLEALHNILDKCKRLII